MVDQITQTVFVLIGVIVFIFILSYFFKKLPISKKLTDNPIVILNIKNISSRDKLILVEIENNRLLLSLSSNGIQKIHLFEKSPMTANEAYQHEIYDETATPSDIPRWGNLKGENRDSPP